MHILKSLSVHQDLHRDVCIHRRVGVPSGVLYDLKHLLIRFLVRS